MIRWASYYRAPFWYVGPSYGLAKDTIWNDPMMLPYYVPDWNNPQSTLIKKSETELRVNFLTSGGQIYVYGADRPDLMRGPNPLGVVLDEFSVQKTKVWEEIVQPIMRSNPRSWCWFLFTPRGKNHAFKVFQYGLDQRDSEWKSWKMDVTESGIFTEDQMFKMRTTSTQQTFAQEYMCEFLEGEGAVFRNVRDIATAEIKEPEANHMYVIGVDLAKHQDYTVISVFDRVNNNQVYQDKFNKIEWPFQKKRIKSISDHYNRALVILDSTGIGDPIFDDLARAGLPILPYKITSPSKKDLIEKLSISIDQKNIRILPIQDTLYEFDNFTYSQSQTGILHYGAPEGFHDDIVISIALAVWSLQPIEAKKTEKPLSVIQLDYLRQKNSYGKTDDESEWNEWSQI